MKTNAAVVRACYSAYETKDRQALEDLLADDFTFTSPIDDHIGRDVYFSRCWPNSEHLRKFDLTHVIEQGNDVFVRYRCETTTGEEFRNVEHFTVADGKIRSVEVFFGSEDAASASEEEIRALIFSWADCIRKKDVAGLARHFAPNPVRFYLAPPLEADQPLEKNAREWFATFQGDIGYEIRDLSITAEGNLAIAHSFNRIQGINVGGEKADVWFRETMGFRKFDGQWKITHEHESVPFAMDGSLRAEVNLQPPGSGSEAGSSR